MLVCGRCRPPWPLSTLIFLIFFLRNPYLLVHGQFRTVIHVCVVCYGKEPRTQTLCSTLFCFSPLELCICVLEQEFKAWKVRLWHVCKQRQTYFYARFIGMHAKTNVCSSPDFLEEMHMHLKNCFVIHSEMSNREGREQKMGC